MLFIRSERTSERARERERERERDFITVRRAASETRRLIVYETRRAFGIR